MNRFGKTLLSMCLAATMALPLPLWAQHRPLTPAEAADAKEGAGVLLQKVTGPNGQSGYLVAAEVEEKDLIETAQHVAKTGDGLLMVSGADDPILKAAASTGRLQNIEVVVAKDAEGIQVPENFKGFSGLKAKFKARINAISNFCKNEKKGLIFAFINSATMTSFAMVSSGDVPTGLAVFAMNFAWVSFLMTSEKAWGAWLDGGGNLFKKVASKAAGLFGKTLSDRDKKLYELGGKFTATWVPNMIQAGVVLWGAGELNLDSYWTAFIQSAYMGLLLNYTIWDSVVLPKIQSGQLSKKFWQTYIMLQVLVGSGLELTSYMGYSWSQAVLSAAMVMGVGYLVGQEKIEETVVPRAKMFNRNLGRKISSATRSTVNAANEVRQAAVRQKQKCEQALTTIKNLRSASGGGIDVEHDFLPFIYLAPKDL